MDPQQRNPRRPIAPVLIVVVLGIAVALLLRRHSAPAAEHAPSTNVATTGTPPAARAGTPGPAPARGDNSARPSLAADAGAVDQIALAGHLITLGQKLSLAEALAKNAAQADALVDRLCDESRALHERAPLPESRNTGGDAAEFMADRVDYEKPLDDPPGSLHLPDELRQRLSKTPDWLRAVTDKDLAGRDFSWLPALARFDRWSYLTAGRLRDNPQRDVLTGSIPNYSSLLAWAKLRYALALRRNDGLVASGEVRHLADLIRTQHVLIAEMVAILLYRFDVQARAAFAAAGADVAAWEPLDTAQLDAQRRLAWGSMYFLYPGVAPETARKAAGCMIAPCTAISEAVAFNRSVGAAAGTDNLALLRELSSSRGCETELTDRLASARELPTAEALDALGTDLPQQLPRYFPAP